MTINNEIKSVIREQRSPTKDSVLTQLVKNGSHTLSEYSDQYAELRRRGKIYDYHSDGVTIVKVTSDVVDA